mmetsp:Transcript_4792/g.13422  ORF Transcript_4792/g.13422 Transcript_4792/m.13422 type:complete len:99 (+) Transcript_4792:1314-1610(+)
MPARLVRGFYQLNLSLAHSPKGSARDNSNCRTNKHRTNFHNVSLHTTQVLYNVLCSLYNLVVQFLAYPTRERGIYDLASPLAAFWAICVLDGVFPNKW